MLLEYFGIFLLFGGNVYAVSWNIVKQLLLELQFIGRKQVGFVENKDHLFVFCFRDNHFSQFFNLFRRSVQVDHPKDDGCLAELLKSAFDTKAFNGIVGFADSGRVDKAESHS